MYKFAVFAYGDVGLASIKIFREHKEQLKAVVLDKVNFWKKNDLILKELENFPKTKVYYYENDDQLNDICTGLDVVILAWWGRIIKGNLLNLPRYGFINLHTSLLPFGKGKHPHFWALASDEPYGVTIMKIDSGLDTGSIIYQKEIEKTWEDTGKSFYFKGIKALCDLIEEKKENIFELNFEEHEQKKGEGSFHYGKEIDEYTEINLDKKYTARELINKIRARTFSPFPAAYFFDDGIKYEIRVDIKKCLDSFDSGGIDYSKISED